MACAVSLVYRAPVQRMGQGEDDKPWRLPPARVQELRDVANGVEESNAGVCCRYLLDALSGEGASHDTDLDGYVHHLEAVERFVERYGDYGRVPVVASWRAKIARTRRAITRMREAGEHRAADILFVVYGPPDPSSVDLIPSLGKDLAPLGRYTDSVETLRLELARLEACAWVRERGDGTVDLAIHRQRLAWAERTVSSGDAMRAAMAAFREPMPALLPGESPSSLEVRREARRDRQKAHDARRAAFLLDVKIEARRMLVEAERVYYAAWLASQR